MYDLRAIQQLQLKIAKEIKRICEKNNIRYFIIAGTLLGAVRHGGFIPWDDDMDIGMERKEYNKFLRAVETDLGDEFIMQTWDKEKNYAFPYGKLMLKNTVWIEAIVENVDITHGIYVDIFPFDNIPNNSLKQKIQNGKYIIYKQLMLALNNYNAFTYKNGLKKLIFLIFIASKCVLSSEQVKKLYVKMILNDKDCDSTYLYAFGMTYSYKKGKIKREWIENLREIKFEDTKFLAPCNTDDYLTCLYGDYMIPPPLDKRENFHGIIECDLGKYK